MNLINVLLLGLLIVWIIFDMILQNRLREQLRIADLEVVSYKAENRRLNDELHTVLQRDEAKRSHQCLIRDQKIEELVNYYEERLREQEAEHKILEDVAHKIWDKVSGK